jgi:hypothetical protein
MKIVRFTSLEQSFGFSKKANRFSKTIFQIGLTLHEISFLCSAFSLQNFKFALQVVD